MNIKTTIKRSHKQNGAALIMALVLLVILTMLGLSTMSTSNMEERMASNSQEINRAFQAASTGLQLVLADDNAFSTNNTVASDGTADDPYDVTDNTIGGTGLYAYNATTTYNSLYRQSIPPPRGSGWDSSYAYYFFDVSASGSTDSGSASAMHAGAYQIGKAP